MSNIFNDERIDVVNEEFSVPLFILLIVHFILYFIEIKIGVNLNIVRFGVIILIGYFSFFKKRGVKKNVRKKNPDIYT
jgi:hypothetical protein